MKLRQTAVAIAFTVAACSSNPAQSPAVTRQLVTAALEPCDSAVHVLTANLAHASGPGVITMARTVEAQCSGSTLDLMKASAPDACRDASEASRLLASAAEAAVGGNPADVVRLQDALGMAEGQRQQCSKAIGETNLT